MIKVNYTELAGPAGPTCRLEASGHAGYAPAGQDIVCAGASTLMQTLCALLAGEKGFLCGVWVVLVPCWQSATRTMSALPT